MTTENYQTIAVAVLLASFPLLAWGGNDGVIVAALAGGIVFAAGALGLTVLRFVPIGED